MKHNYLPRPVPNCLLFLMKRTQIKSPDAEDRSISTDALFDESIWVALPSKSKKTLSDYTIRSIRQRVSFGSHNESFRKITIPSIEFVHCKDLMRFKAIERAISVGFLDQDNMIHRQFLVRFLEHHTSYAFEFLRAMESAERVQYSKPSPLPNEFIEVARKITRNPDYLLIDHTDLRFGNPIKTLCVTLNIPSPHNLGSLIQTILQNPTRLIPALMHNQFRILFQRVLTVMSFSLSRDIYDIGKHLTKATYKQLDAFSLRRNLKIFAGRYGVYGPKQRTLKCIGDKYGMTRERVRQITEHQIAGCKGGTIFSFAFSRLVNRLSSINSQPHTVVELENRELLGKHLDIKVARTFGLEILARDLPINTRDIQRRGQTASYITRKHSEIDKQYESIISYSYRFSHRFGCSQLHTLVGWLNSIQDFSLSFKDVKNVLTSLDQFTWIDEPGGWYWHGDHKDNQVTNRIYKSLYVAPAAVNIDELYAAVSRSFRIEYKKKEDTPEIWLPPSVFQNLCSNLPALTSIQYNRYRFKDKPTQSRLSETESLTYDLLKSDQNGGIGSRLEIFDFVISQLGVSKMAMSMLVDKSPIIIPVSRGIYRLTGWETDSGYIQLCDQRRMFATKNNSCVSTKPHVGKGANHEELDLRYCITQGALNSGQLSIPWHISYANFPTGEYAVKGLTGSLFYNSNTKRISRIKAIVRHFNIVPGDYIQLTFNKSSMSVSVKKTRSFD